MLHLCVVCHTLGHFTPGRCTPTVCAGANLFVILPTTYLFLLSFTTTCCPLPHVAVTLPVTWDMHYLLFCAARWTVLPPPQHYLPGLLWDLTYLRVIYDVCALSPRFPHTHKFPSLLHRLASFIYFVVVLPLFPLPLCIFNLLSSHFDCSSLPAVIVDWERFGYSPLCVPFIIPCIPVPLDVPFPFPFLPRHCDC